MEPEEIVYRFVGMFVIALISTWIVWTLWPWVMVEVFHLPELPFRKAWLLVMIAYALHPMPPHKP